MESDAIFTSVFEVFGRTVERYYPSSELPHDAMKGKLSGRIPFCVAFIQKASCFSQDASRGEPVLCGGETARWLRHLYYIAPACIRRAHITRANSFRREGFTFTLEVSIFTDPIGQQSVLRGGDTHMHLAFWSCIGALA